jgi:uncharacterized protein
MYIERDLEAKIRKYLDSREIIAIVGPRQCGKTTLMEHLAHTLKGAKMISFEDREALELFAQDSKAFISLYAKGADYLFIDEFQYAKQGGRQLKYIYDTIGTKLIISGSSAPDLSVQSIKYLVGRIFVFNLYPLSFDEYLRHKDRKLFGAYSGKPSKPLSEMINKHYEEFAIYGGYPRAVLAKDDEERVEVLKGIYNTYFLKEIKEILQLPDDFKLSRLIKILSLQAGGIANYGDLSSATGFEYKYLLKHLNVLMKTYVCAESRPFFTNKKKELVKAPKLFFIDNGLRNYAAGNFQGLGNRADRGALNENFVASELVKRGIELKYWRTKAKAEVDFIAEVNGKVTPIEVKSSLAGARLTRSFRNFLEEYTPESGFVLSQDLIEDIAVNGTRIMFRPLFLVGSIAEKLKV